MKYELKAYAKINIGLNVLKKEPWESKHKIHSIFSLVDYLYDEITITESGINWIEYYHNHKLIRIKDDIIERCIQYLRKTFNIKQSYEITVIKNIPMGAGLGGSSTDGAVVMKKILEINHIPLDVINMQEVALELGSDIPFFLSGYQMAEVAEYGDYVRKISGPQPSFEIIPTDIKCNTRNIYQAFTYGGEEYKMNDYQTIIKSLPHLRGNKIYNNLEPYAIKLNPELAKFKKEDTILSGSGGYFIRWK